MGYELFTGYGFGDDDEVLGERFRRLGGPWVSR
jgi:hypothetical protein